jgi:outer membrane protein OmpA-like peptidoglycan-associated protein
METSDGNETSAGPTATVMADRPYDGPPLKMDADVAGIEVGDGLIAVALAPSAERDRVLGSIAFAPGSAALPPDAAARLERFLAEVKAPDARIRVVGEAAAPALALDRALAVGLALLQRGVPADRLELTLAQGAAGDQARLSLITSAP